MGMVVQHNMQSMNANRMLGITTGQQAKSTEKLSSGYKINRAADDAAGLSISEKMRRQIRGLDRASTNAQDGISSVQTAEGALNEVHDMLQRMNELANQAANGTNSSSDRQSIQDEISQLTTEIDRVAETTKFNELYLLKGDAGTKTINVNAHDAGLSGVLSDQGDEATFTTTVNTDSEISIAGKNYHIYKETDDEVATLQDKVGQSKDITINGTTYTLQGIDPDKMASLSTAITSVASNAACMSSLSDCLASVTEKYNTAKASLDKMLGEDLTNASNASIAASMAACVGSLTDCLASVTDKYEAAETKYKSAKKDLDTLNAKSVYMSNGKEYTTEEVKALIVDGAKVGVDGKKARTAVDKVNNKNNKTLDEVSKLMRNALLQANQIGVDDETAVSVDDQTLEDGKETKFTITKGTVEVSKEKSFDLHVGADADLTNKISVDIETMNSKYLGVNKLNVVDDSGIAATYAIDAIEDAISKVNEQRSSLGAVQNRLEHTISNLDNVVENTQSSESSIRDTDMADEMVRYSKNNILAQAGQSMLAQANQSTQGVLSILG